MQLEMMQSISWPNSARHHPVAGPSIEILFGDNFGSFLAGLFVRAPQYPAVKIVGGWWVGGLGMKQSLQLVHFLQISIVTPSSSAEWKQREEVGPAWIWSDKGIPTATTGRYHTISE